MTAKEPVEALHWGSREGEPELGDRVQEVLVGEEEEGEEEEMEEEQ